MRIYLLLQPCAGRQLPKAQNVLTDMLHEDPGGLEALLEAAVWAQHMFSMIHDGNGLSLEAVLSCAGDLSGGLPGSNVTRGDLPDGPKPGEALKNLPKGSAGSQVSSQVCQVARLWAVAAPGTESSHLMAGSNATWALPGRSCL